MVLMSTGAHRQLMQCAGGGQEEVSSGGAER